MVRLGLHAVTREGRHRSVRRAHPPDLPRRPGRAAEPPIPGGNTEIESKGKLVVTITFTSQPDHHHTFEVSGPSIGKSSQIAYVNGDHLYRATGANLLPAFGTAVANSGLPRLACTKGAVGVLCTGSDEGDVMTRAKTVIDVCKSMGLDSVP